MSEWNHKLMEARLRKTWSPSKLAEKVGVSLATVQRWEAGETKPHGYNLERLAQVLELNPEFILEIARPARLPVASSPQPASTKALQGLITQDLTLHLWSLSSSQSCRTCQQVHGAMVRILKDHENMNDKNHHIPRRKALLRLIALPLVTLGIATFTNEESLGPAKAKEVLMQCAVSIGACWELTKSAERSDLFKAFHAVSTYLPTLQKIVKDSSEHRQEATGLVAQCLLLKAILAHHVENLVNAASYAQQALTYSKEAHDLSLQLRVLECLAVVYTFDKSHQQALQTIEQATPLLKQTSIPISSHAQALVSGMLACCLVRNGQDGASHLDQAEKLLVEPDTIQPVYVGYNKNGLLFDTAVVHYQQGNSTKALEALSQLVDPETLTSRGVIAEIRRIETINTMTMISLKSKNKDMEQTIHFWTAGIQAARALHSGQRFREALMANEIMQALWPNEKRIQELRDLTQH